MSDLVLEIYTILVFGLKQLTSVESHAVSRLQIFMTRVDALL